ncbi:hypothetical protein N3K66_006969 [Trichothecium roseum]|uniref:Uncharacterized protein n=1 Tax=Trichothecium roseum TaxID=47278 RepID=A0ACC0UWX5_9HYPO|nr:hypothetical protein N3K66_006969 [Trichothecium roseum]
MDTIPISICLGSRTPSPPAPAPAPAPPDLQTATKTDPFLHDLVDAFAALLSSKYAAAAAKQNPESPSSSTRYYTVQILPPTGPNGCWCPCPSHPTSCPNFSSRPVLLPSQLSVSPYAPSHSHPHSSSSFTGEPARPDTTTFVDPDLVARQYMWWFLSQRCAKSRNRNHDHRRSLRIEPRPSAPEANALEAFLNTTHRQPLSRPHRHHHHAQSNKGQCHTAAYHDDDDDDGNEGDGYNQDVILSTHRAQEDLLHRLIWNLRQPKWSRPGTLRSNGAAVMRPWTGGEHLVHGVLGWREGDGLARALTELEGPMREARRRRRLTTLDE